MSTLRYDPKDIPPLEVGQWSGRYITLKLIAAIHADYAEMHFLFAAQGLGERQRLFFNTTPSPYMLLRLRPGRSYIIDVKELGYGGIGGHVISNYEAGTVVGSRLFYKAIEFLDIFAGPHFCNYPLITYDDMWNKNNEIMRIIGE